MSFLLDTHVLLWAAGTPGCLPVEVRRIIEDPSEEMVFSVASVWEVAMKSSVERLDFQIDPRLF